MDQPNSVPSSDPSTTRPVGSAPPKTQASWNESMSQLDTYTERARVALPAIPSGLADGYMRFAPWVAIIVGALGVLLSLALLVGATALSPLMVIFLGVGSTGSAFGSLIIGLIISALGIAGGYLMLQRRVTGWWILALGIVVDVLSTLFGRSIVLLIVLLLIAYVHLQVKPNYR